MYRYKFQIPAVCNAPQVLTRDFFSHFNPPIQGENKEAIEKAQTMVDAAQNAMEEVFCVSALPSNSH